MSVKVSIIIPSYNHAQYIKSAVSSVFAQTLSDLELIVIDDGSRDDSLQILRAIQDSRLKVIAQENQGAHAAINRGLSMASGDYLSILNSDDLYHPERLAKLVTVLEENPALGLAGSYITVIDGNNTALGVKEGFANMSPWPLDAPELSFRAGTDLRSALLTENYLATTSNYIFPRACYEAIGGFRPLRYTHDWDFALRVINQFDLHLEPQALMNYRVHDSNTIRENKVAMVFEILWIMAVHLPRQMNLVNQMPAGLEKLYHSIYTFDCSPVLNSMLLQGYAFDEDRALALLKPENETRAKYLEMIAASLAEEPVVSAQNAGLAWQQKVRNWWQSREINR